MTRARHALRAAALLALTVVGGVRCASNPADVVSKGITDAVSGFEDLFALDLPSEHLRRLRDLQEPNLRRLRADVPDALEQSCAALRALGATNYASWRDAAIVTQVVSALATEHTAGLVRVESLDTLAQLAPWTVAADVPAETSYTEADAFDALRVLGEARGKSDSDPSFTAEVLHAVRTLGGYRFESPASVGADASDRAFAQRRASELRSARGVLQSFTTSLLEGFVADPEIRDAMDRAYVSLGASVLRLSFVVALSSDGSDAVRANAARHLGELTFPVGAAALTRAVRGDTSSPVRRAACTALGRHPAEVAVPPLLDALRDPLPDVRGAAARALAAATGEDLGDDRAAWQRWWSAQSAPSDGGATR